MHFCNFRPLENLCLRKQYYKDGKIHTFYIVWGQYGVAVGHGCASSRSGILRVCLFFFFQYWSLNSGPTPWSTPPARFLWKIFSEIGSGELFAWDGFELRSSQSLSSEYYRHGFVLKKKNITKSRIIMELPHSVWFQGNAY
jgi:hypothetical protein